MTSTRTTPARPQLKTSRLVELRQRLDRPQPPASDFGGWNQGVTTDWLGGILADWAAFDTRQFQLTLDGLGLLDADIDGQHLSLLYVPGRGPSPMPLLLTNGWPSSFLEYTNVISPLTDPESHGGDAGESFTVVIPSLPGFGFSAPPPPETFSATEVATLWHQLMTVGLGFEKYLAHGSDLGAGVTARLARTHPEAVVAIHLATPGLAVPPGPCSPAEEQHRNETDAWVAEEGGYAHIQSTKPSTLGAALNDSPLGLAAWIGEKIMAWSSPTAHGEPAFERDLLLQTLTIYWTTECVTSSFLPYWNFRHAPGSALPSDSPPKVPTALTNFGGEKVPFPKPPRELADRYFNVTSWAEHDRGGHFPAAAEPELFVESLRGAFRPYRSHFSSHQPL